MSDIIDGDASETLEEIILPSQKDNILKSLEEFMEQKHVIVSTDIINLILSVSLFLIYVCRTYMMCLFDS